jgi:hypothetical protein
MANRSRSRNSGRGPAPAATTSRAKPAASPPRVSATKDGGVSGANRKERKEEARRQREALLRKQNRRRYYRIAGMVAGAVVALAVVLVLWHPWSKPAPKAVDQSALPGLMTSTDTASWTANTDQLEGRLSVLGLPELGAEQLAYHIHQNLNLFIDGKQVQIPANIGIAGANELAVIHVHPDATGGSDNVIHVESPEQKLFTLGDFFGVWGLNFTPTSIGGYTDGGGKTLQVYLDGKKFTGNPTTMPLANHEVITVAYGTQAELPKPIPSTFDWANSSAGG